MSGWVPVSERLPLELPSPTQTFQSIDVLAFDGYQVQQMDFQAGNGAGTPWRAFTNYGSLRPQDITHWMPLPAPPTGAAP